jgi:hypothetical protein
VGGGAGAACRGCYSLIGTYRYISTNIAVSLGQLERSSWSDMVGSYGKPYCMSREPGLVHPTWGQSL